MQELINLVCNGSVDFTAETVVGILILCMSLECIGSIAYSLLSVGRG